MNKYKITILASGNVSVKDLTEHFPNPLVLDIESHDTMSGWEELDIETVSIIEIKN